MSWRTKRRLIYLGVFFLIVFIIGFLIYLNFKKSLPQCLNNRQDIDEEGVDCGGPCPPCELKTAQPFKIYQSEFIVYSDKTFDILGIIENPNQKLGLKKLKYQFLIYDLDNVLKLQTPIRETIILPSEKRYLVEINNQPINFTISKIELKIYEPEKEDFIKIEPEKLPVTYSNPQIYKENNNWKISLTLFNNSFKSLKPFDVIVLVYNNKSLIGLGKTIFSLGPHESKKMILRLPQLNLEPTGFEIYFQKISLE